MIYLDYSATTPVNDEVLNSFNLANKEFIGNANSLHTLGINCNKLISSASKQIADILNIKENEIIYTSSSTEANNMAIKGIAYKYQNRGKHIITSVYEHSSVNSCLDFLAKNGFEISYVKCDENGLIDLDDLRNLIRKDTILVTINHVNSEIGLKEPIEEIAKIVKEYPNCFFHTDLTQSIGKVKINLENIDLASFSAHKIYGLKGIACLIKKENCLIEPLIHGGKSTTNFRSGTPAHPLIVSISKALRLATENLDEKYLKVKNLNDYLKRELGKFKDVVINSNDYSIPHILNISILNIKPETFMHALETENIFISTKTACSKDDTLSTSVYNLTKDEKKAKSSLRISLSFLTTKEELDEFLKVFAQKLQELKLN